MRQVAFVDASGEVGVHTGDDCIREFGHLTGEGFSVQANMMERDTVWTAMADAYRDAEGDLPYRLLAALGAAQSERGDIRGMQSAAMLVVEAEPTGNEWDDRVIDLRIEDHATPVDELARLVRLWRAYGHAERAEDLELAGDLGGALEQRLLALEIQPDHPEIAFWAAVAMAGARPVRRGAAHSGDRARGALGWAELLRRVVDDGQIELSDEAVRALLPEAD